MLKDLELALPQPDPHKAPPPPCPPDPSQENQWHDEHCEPDPSTEKLWICIRYCENPTEFTPAPFDDCGCNTNGQQPNRICEAFELKIFEGEEPEFMKKVHEHRHCCEEANCIDIYQRILKECRGPCGVGWLPLAVITGFIPGQPVTKEMIDNWSVRPILPSTRMLDHLIQCILEHLPPAPLTTISDFNWGHGEVYHCREFLNRYVAKQDDPSHGFVITFSDPVHQDGIDNHSFQATIVRTPQNPQQARTTEVPPATVTVAADGMKCTLSIDSNYAHQHLDGQNFDVYIRLRCDVVVDERGHAVDGNLLARYDGGSYLVDGPTGDGIPGGLFESWIQVRMAAPKRL
jgi:hypothetical protein